MKKGVLWTLLVALALGLALSAGCAKEAVPPPSAQVSAEEQARLKAQREKNAKLREAKLKEDSARTAETKLREVFVNQDIHFNYDRYDLTVDAKRTLNDKAAYMQSHPAIKIIVEGNCDERGSSAYNMALGEKRAKAAAAYLEAMGIDPNRIETVSYGEEKPLVLGHTEEAYAANRRGHFVIK